MEARKSKVISSSSPQFLTGLGKNSMKSQTGVGPQEPGVTATTQNSKSGKGSLKVGVRGGGTKMFGRTGVKAVKPA